MLVQLAHLLIHLLATYPKMIFKKRRTVFLNARKSRRDRDVGWIRCLTRRSGDSAQSVVRCTRITILLSQVSCLFLCRCYCSVNLSSLLNISSSGLPSTLGGCDRRNDKYSRAFICCVISERFSCVCFHVLCVMIVVFVKDMNFSRAAPIVLNR